MSRPTDSRAGPSDERLQRGVWLAPIFAAPGVTRVACSIPSGADVFVDTGGTLCFEHEVTDPAGLGPYCRVNERALPSMQTVLVNGRAGPRTGTAVHRAVHVRLPADHPFGVGPGPVEMVYPGRSIVVSGLRDGVHTIGLLHRIAPNEDDIEFDVDVRYRIVVGDT